MNMFKPVKARSIKEYFSALPEDRQAQMKAVDVFIRKTVPALKPNFLYNMPGYGTFKYKSGTKKELLDWPTIGLASQKNYISLYVCALNKGKYIAEQYKDDLGTVSVGKSCIRFKKIEDLNLKTLAKVLKMAAKSPGLVHTTKK